MQLTYSPYVQVYLRNANILAGQPGYNDNLSIIVVADKDLPFYVSNMVRMNKVERMVQ